MGRKKNAAEIIANCLNQYRAAHEGTTNKLRVDEVTFYLRDAEAYAIAACSDEALHDYMHGDYDGSGYDHFSPDWAENVIDGQKSDPILLGACTL